MAKSLNPTSLGAPSLSSPPPGRDSGGQRLLNVFVVTGYLLLQSTSSAHSALLGAVCQTQNTSNKSIAQLGWKHLYFGLHLFMPVSPDLSPAWCWPSWPRCPIVCPSFQVGFWTQNQSQILNIAPTNSFPRSVLLSRTELVLFNWTALIVPWACWRGLFLFLSAKPEDMLQVLEPPWESTETLQHSSQEPRGGVLSSVQRWNGERCTVALLHIPGLPRGTDSR